MSYEWMKDCTFVLADSIAALHELAAEIRDSETPVAVDYETTGLDTLVARIVGIAISPKPDIGYYIPIDHKDSNNVNMEDFKRIVLPTILEKKSVYFNAVYDRTMSRVYDFDTPNFEDVMILIFMKDPEKLKNISLKKASENFLGRKMIEYVELFTEEERKRKKGKKPELQLRNKTAEHCLAYGCSDAINTLQLWIQNRHLLSKDQEPVFNLDNKFLDYLIDITRTGYNVDKEYLVDLKSRMENKIDELQKELDDAAGFPVRVNAKSDIWQALESFGVKPKTFTATGQPGSGEKDLQKIDHWFAKHILYVRGMRKSVTGDIDKLLAGIHPVTNKAHSAYTYTGTSTGRLSSKGWPPKTKKGINIQQAQKVIINNPKHPCYEDFKDDSIRIAIVPPEGYIHVKFDLSGAELRIAAHISKEPTWLEEFNRHGDPHQRLADEMNAKFPGIEMSRSKAKNCHFNMLYSFYWSTFAQNTGITMDEAKSLYQGFFNTVKHYDKWREYEKAKMRKRGYARTYYGRRRVLGSYYKAMDLKKTMKPYDKSPDGKEKYKKYMRLITQGDREGINHTIQGSCLDILKRNAIRIRNCFKKTGEWNDTVIPLMTVHDELNFAVKAESFADPYFLQTCATIHQYMIAKPDGFIVDIESECEVGWNWKQLKEITKDLEPYERKEDDSNKRTSIVK